MSLPIYKATEANVTTFCILAEASVATNVENLGEVSVAIVAEASVAIAVEANVATDQKNNLGGGVCMHKCIFLKQLHQSLYKQLDPSLKKIHSSQR